jgi:hypothetical protein
VINPTLEIMSNDQSHPLDSEGAVDAALDYHFDAKTAEHVVSESGAFGTSSTGSMRLSFMPFEYNLIGKFLLLCYVES